MSNTRQLVGRVNSGPAGARRRPGQKPQPRGQRRAQAKGESFLRRQLRRHPAQQHHGVQIHAGSARSPPGWPAALATPIAGYPPAESSIRHARRGARPWPRTPAKAAPPQRASASKAGWLAIKARRRPRPGQSARHPNWRKPAQSASDARRAPAPAQRRFARQSPQSSRH